MLTFNYRSAEQYLIYIYLYSSQILDFFLMNLQIIIKEI